MNGRRRIGWLGALAAITMAGATVAAAADLGRCNSAELQGPLVLPDGTLHEARSVRVCFSREYSPVAGLHEISVDGRPVGMFLGREYPIESKHGREPYLLLERDAAGQLELRGYATRDSVHDLAPDAMDAEASVRASWQLLTKR